MKRILSISGGGVRDLIPAIILDLIQAELKQPDITELFDLIVGVSGGALLAMHAAVAKLSPPSTESFSQLFSEANMKRIFDKSFIDTLICEIQLRPEYDGQAKTDILKSYLGNSIMSDFSDINVAMPVYNFSKRRPEVISTYDASFNNWPAWQACDASSAAIPYFPPVQSFNGDIYLDGGFAASDPVLIAYAEAKKLFGDDTPIQILSLGTGRECKTDYNMDDLKKWGGIQWLYNGLTDLMMNAPNELMQMEIKNVMRMDKQSLLCINPEIPTVKMDDTSASSLNILRSAAHSVFESNKPLVHEFFTYV